MQLKAEFLEQTPGNWKIFDRILGLPGRQESRAKEYSLK